jgi:tetratricopeptide (TPR) repeat protein
MKKIIIASLIAFTACRIFAAREYQWSWEMPANVYRSLEFTIRSTVDRANKVFASAWEDNRHNRLNPQQQVSRFRAAAAEWKKVQIQAETESTDTAFLGYVAFMQAYSRHLARDRNEAVRLYQEMLDLYGDEPWIASAATYQMAQARISMGDVKAGRAILEEMIENEDFANEKCTAYALHQRGCWLWDEGKEEEAIEMWERVIGKFKETVYWTWNASRSELQRAYAVTMRFQDMERIIFLEIAPDNQIARAKAILNCINWKIYEMSRDHHRLRVYFVNKYTKPSKRRDMIVAFDNAFEKWIAGVDSIIRAGNLGWEFKMTMFKLKVSRATAEQFAQITTEMVKELKAEKAVDVRTKNANAAIWTLCERGRYAEAQMVVPMIEGAASQAWVRYEIDVRMNNWKSAAQNLNEAIGHAKDPAFIKRVKYVLAEVYRDRLRDYEKAIKLYVDLADPPRSLWELQAAYRSAGKKKECYAALSELMSIFPDYAARAVYRMAQYREADGEKKAAIALYKRLMKHPEWKKSHESSLAHQQLERLGVATGGAVVNTVH